MPTTSPSTSKGKHKGDQETNEQVDIMSDIYVSTSPPTPSATAEPPPPPTQPYIRNRDLTDLRKSPNSATRQTVVHIFRRILVLELVVLFVTLLSITLRGHFSLDRMRKDVHSWMNIWHVAALTDFFRVIGSVVSNSIPVRQGDHDNDDSFEPTGNLVADEIKRRGWALFPARQAPKRPPQEQGPLVDPNTVPPNYGAMASEQCPDPSSLSSASSTSTPETLPSETDSPHPAPPEPPKPTFLSVGKLAYNDKPVLILVPGRNIMHFIILYFVGFDIARRLDCLQKLPDCKPVNDDNPPWLVAIIVMDVFIELVYIVESVVLYRARKQITRLLEDMAAVKEAQVHVDADVSV